MYTVSHFLIQNTQLFWDWISPLPIGEGREARRRRSGVGQLGQKYYYTSSILSVTRSGGTISKYDFVKK